MARQRSIRDAIAGSGIGVHSGRRVDIRLLPPLTAASPSAVATLIRP